MKTLLYTFLFCLSTITIAQEVRITSVDIQGKYGQDVYNVRIGIASPDTGCEQYANWWEIVTLEGKLVYRRILSHSHVNEQPFIRGASKVQLDKDQEYYIRVHMNNTGYSRFGHEGSITSRFRSTELPEDFALELANEAPLPKGCDF